MPKNEVSAPITDQEMAFALLILSETMTDRRAAEVVGLNPDSAACTKAKPGVRDYMLEHRAAVEQQLVQQEAESLQHLNQDRERVLTRLWEIAYLSPEMTRGSITGQVKAISMIIAIQGLIPGQKKPAPAPPIHTAAWRAGQQATTQPTKDAPQPIPAPAQQKEVPGKPAATPRSAKKPRPNPDPTGDVIAQLVRASNPLLRSQDSLLASVPYTTRPFDMNISPFYLPR